MSDLKNSLRKGGDRIAGINNIKLKVLEGTIFFYERELKREDLTEKERDKYFGALKSIKKIIKKRLSRSN